MRAGSISTRPSPSIYRGSRSIPRAVADSRAPAALALGRHSRRLLVLAGIRRQVFALRTARTLYAPGTAWSYSNDGYETAGAILAQLDGRTWPDAVQARVFDSIGMTDSSPVFTPDALSHGGVGLPVSRQRPPAVAASGACGFARFRLRRSGRLGSVDARRHGALHALLSQRRPLVERQTVTARPRRSLR